MAVTITIPVEVAIDVTADVSRASFHELQRDIRREARRGLLRALGEALAAVEKALVATPIVCAACQRPMRSRGRSARRVVTVFGSVAVKRVRYGCPTCHATRRPLDEWLGLAEGSEYTDAVCEQALYLAADLSYERAADVLRHVGGIGISGRQIQRLLEAEGEHLAGAVGAPTSEPGTTLRTRFRRTARSTGVDRVLQLRRLKSSGKWDEYWASRFRSERAARAAGGGRSR
jgi:hypothetical protein